MNRNFTTFALIIWILAYIVSVSGDQVGAAKAQLAGKILIVFFWLWLGCFVLIVLQALVEVGKDQNKKPFDWSSMK